MKSYATTVQPFSKNFMDQKESTATTMMYLFGVLVYVTLLARSASSVSTIPPPTSEACLDFSKFSTDEKREKEMELSPGFIPSSNEIIVIGIAGGSGSGKTTLAQAIYKEVGEENITYISHDMYYKDISHLSFSEREKQNFDHPDSLDTSLLIEHLSELRKGNNVSIPQYDFSTHSRKNQTVLTMPRPIILVEGILILSDKALLELMDIRVFVDTEDDIRLIRRIQRDQVERGRSLEGIIGQYLATVRPMHLEFVEASKRNAHIIVPVGLNEVVLDLVVSRLKAAIKKYKRSAMNIETCLKS